MEVNDTGMTALKADGTVDDLPIDRRSGVALWRQIADRIRQGIASGELAGGGRLPPELELSARFGVNRHTIRAAIAALAQEGVLRAERGRGTFVEHSRRLAYPIGSRTRFGQGLAAQTYERDARLVESATEPATAAVAGALDLDEGAAVVRLETVSSADGRPVSRSSGWFDAARLPDIAMDFQEHRSITAALAAGGIADYLRRSTVIMARHAESGDLDDLRLSPGAIVLVATAINVDMAGRPLQYQVTRFAADRIELRVDPE